MRSEAAGHYRRLDPRQQSLLRAALVDDLTSESDARFLEPQLRAQAWSFSEAFWSVQERWAADERRHCRGVLDVAQACFGFEAQELERRQPDFSALERLFDDPFATLLLLAYDECATVYGYRGNLALYDLLGPAYGRFVRDMIADEARHYAEFLELAVLEFGPRLDEAPALLERILAAEGEPYAATFVLDHDDPVFSRQLLARAANSVLGALERRRVAARHGVSFLVTSC